MAATTGFSAAVICAKIVRSPGSAVAAGVLNCRTSAPPLKPRPDPVMATPVTASSANACARASLRPLRVVSPRPFTGGFAISMTATPSTISRVTVSDIVCCAGDAVLTGPCSPWWYVDVDWVPVSASTLEPADGDRNILLDYSNIVNYDT